MQSRHNYSVVIGFIVISSILLALVAEAQQQIQSPEYQPSDTKVPFKENSKFISIFPKCDIALDTALATMTPVLKEVSLTTN